MFTNSRRHSGFSLIELILFIVIISVGITGILGVMNVTTRHSADPMVRKQVLSIAEALLEEIMLKDFADPPGGYSGSDRAQFDDVSDYSGYTTTGIVDISGTAIGGLGDYNISPVSVDGTASLGALGGGEVKLITVTVTGPGNESIAISGYRTNYAP